MKPTVYLETTIPSYLTARPSRDLVLAAHQQLTHDWWELQREDFSLITSQLVLDEAAAGDPAFARRRLELLEGVPLLESDEHVVRLAQSVIEHGILSRDVIQDVLHIAMATVHGVDFLLTWNCKHIANIIIQRRIAKVCRELGYSLTGICTPEELKGA